jgi:hypothetical protein
MPASEPLKRFPAASYLEDGTLAFEPNSINGHVLSLSVESGAVPKLLTHPPVVVPALSSKCKTLIRAYAKSQTEEDRVRRKIALVEANEYMDRLAQRRAGKRKALVASKRSNVPRPTEAGRKRPSGSMTEAEAKRAKKSDHLATERVRVIRFNALIQDLKKECSDWGLQAHRDKAGVLEETVLLLDKLRAASMESRQKFAELRCLAQLMADAEYRWMDARRDLINARGEGPVADASAAEKHWQLVFEQRRRQVEVALGHTNLRGTSGGTAAANHFHDPRFH